MSILLLLASIASADDIDSNLVTHVRAAPRTRIAHMPGMKEGYCIFALVAETDASPVEIQRFEVIEGAENLLQNIPTGNRILPRTPNWYTWEVMALLKEKATVRVSAYGKSVSVEVAQRDDGACSVQSVVQEGK